MQNERKRVKLKPGTKFGRLTVIREGERAEADNYGQRHRRFLCKCSCGTTKSRLYMMGNLRTGASKSCGCTIKEYLRENKNNIKHGLSNTPIYREHWRFMEQANERRISVDAELSDVETYAKLMKKLKWKQGMRLERINPRKRYSADNVKLVSHPRSAGVQHGKGYRVRYIVNGVEFATLQSIADVEGVSREAIRLRFQVQREGYYKKRIPA